MNTALRFAPAPLRATNFALNQVACILCGRVDASAVRDEQSEPYLDLSSFSWLDVTIIGPLTTEDGEEGHEVRLDDGATTWRQAGAGWEPTTWYPRRMPKSSWSPRRERQYEHILTQCIDRGRRSLKTCKRIAAATVNKTRSAKGETKKARR